MITLNQTDLLSTVYLVVLRQSRYRLSSNHELKVSFSTNQHVPPFALAFLPFSTSFTLNYVTIVIVGLLFYDYYGFIRKPLVHMLIIADLLRA